ncbi:MAG: manganese efflux pump MntP family protein [Eubacteriales bacterium]|jgi:putative Mn2+ efflux pump MntP|nr:manganese efflux pump [Clostridiales bacterium]
MSLLEILLVAIGVAADAFAVAVCKGMAKGKFELSYASVVGLYLGGFQALMPVIGYFAGSAATSLIKSIDHWVAFGLLAIIGINMIRESFDDEGCERTAADIGVKAMLPLAVATSIDAAAVGVSFAFLNVKILPAALIVGSVTFIASIVAVWLGAKCSDKLKQLSTLIGGIVLVAIGLKILIEGLIA